MTEENGLEKDRLKERLSALHRELEGSDSVDQDMRRRLTELDQDIHRLLDQTGSADSHGDSHGEDHADTGTDVGEALSEQVRETAANFQAEHPRTYRVLREIADTLSKLGI